MTTTMLLPDRAPPEGARRRRAWALGVGVAVAVHALPFALALRGPSRARPVEIEILGGAPAGPAALRRAPTPRSSAERRRPQARPAARAASRPRAVASAAPPAPSVPKPAPPREEQPPPATSLVGFGPAGSRLTLFIKLDRLRASPFAQAARDLVVRVPGMSGLVRGTELDLYEAFDALLIATPDPRSPGSTFLAARHHLTDDDMRAALERGADAAGQRLVWSELGGHPVAQRRAREDDGGVGRSPDGDGLVIMAAPGLVVVAPSLYRSLLAAAPAAGDVDAGGAPATIAFDGPALRARLDAQGEALGDDGFALATAVDLEPWAQRALSFGVLDDAPRTLSALARGPRAPSIVLHATLASEAPAQRWASAWPALVAGRRLPSWTRTLSSASLERDGADVALRLAPSAADLGELLDALAAD